MSSSDSLQFFSFFAAFDGRSMAEAILAVAGILFKGSSYFVQCISDIPRMEPTVAVPTPGSFAIEFTAAQTTLILKSLHPSPSC